MKNKIITKISVNNTIVRVMKNDNVDYVSLTDLARYVNQTEPSFTVKDWMRRVSTINYIGLWEQLNNTNFNLGEFTQIKMEYGTNPFYMSPTQWIKRTNAIGIFAKGGKYSIGTFAHPDIAFEFASWLSPEFKLYLITEFERLKKNEAYQSKIEWSVKREISKANYLIHTDSIKEYIVPILTERQKQFVYADEADVLNVALFGMTAKEWRDKNPKLNGNIRDYTDVLNLVVLANLENLNASMIVKGISQRERIESLNDTAKKQLQILRNKHSIKRLESMDKKT